MPKDSYRMRRRILEMALANGARQAVLPARYRSPGRSDLPPFGSSSRGTVLRESTPGGERRQATGLRAGLIEDVAKPGEEENNKVRRRKLLSFFTG